MVDQVYHEPKIASVFSVALKIYINHFTHDILRKIAQFCPITIKPDKYRQKKVTVVLPWRPEAQNASLSTLVFFTFTVLFCTVFYVDEKASSLFLVVKSPNKSVRKKRKPLVPRVRLSG